MAKLITIARKRMINPGGLIFASGDNLLLEDRIYVVELEELRKRSLPQQSPVRQLEAVQCGVARDLRQLLT